MLYICIIELLQIGTRDIALVFVVFVLLVYEPAFAQNAELLAALGQRQPEQF